MTFKAPYIGPDAIETEASRFLSRFHPDLSLPIPIEFIIESELGMDIIPINGLERSFTIVAFISRNLTEICVDEHTYSTSEPRYRFSLAHELGHKYLRGEARKKLGAFETIQEWKQVVASDIPENEYGYLEFHASTFAAMVLVPTEPLTAEFNNCVQMAKGAWVDLSDPKIGGRDNVESFIAKKFKVSRPVIHRRLEYLELWDNS